MENSSNHIAESIAEPTLLEDQQSDFNPQAVNLIEPEDEEEGEDEVEEEDKGEDEDADNPPRDPKIVHSPVTTQPGGSPK